MPLDRRRLLAGCLAGAFLVAGCGSQPSPTGGTVPASGATASATAPAATSSAAPTPTPTPAFPTTSPLAADAAALEALLPASAGGVSFTRSSGDGTLISGAGRPAVDARLAPVLARYGLTLADVRVATAVPADQGTAQSVLVLAIEIAGIPASDWLADAVPGAGSLVKATIGGKAVLATGSGTFPTITYPRGDVLFEILLASDAMAAAIVAELP